MILLSQQLLQHKYHLNCAPLIKCITKNDEATIYDKLPNKCQRFRLVMPMYNLIEYSSNYSETAGSSWFYSNDRATYFNTDIANNDNFKSFKYNVELWGNTAAQPAPNAANRILKNATVAVPLKHLSNLLRSFEMPLINCKVELKHRCCRW